MDGLFGKTLIPLTNGEQIPIKELKKGDKIYCVDKTTNEVIEGKVTACSKSNKVEQLRRLEFYNTSYIILSNGQELITLDGKPIKVSKLKIGEHIMPFNLKNKDNKQGNFEAKSYFIIKQIKYLEDDEVYDITTDKHSIAIITTMVRDNKPNEFGGCFIKA